MPVGTTIGIATDEGVLLEAMVAEVHEQVGGSERAPGMMVKPKLDADAARTWWKQRVTRRRGRASRCRRPIADGKVTVDARADEPATPRVPELDRRWPQHRGDRIVDRSRAPAATSRAPDVTDPSAAARLGGDRPRRTRSSTTASAR